MTEINIVKMIGLGFSVIFFIFGFYLGRVSKPKDGTRKLVDTSGRDFPEPPPHVFNPKKDPATQIFHPERTESYFD